MVRTPAIAGPARTGVVVSSIDTAGALMVTGFAVVAAAATATAAGTRTCLLVATPGR